MTKMQGIQAAESRGRWPRLSGLTLVVAALVAALSMAFAVPALAVEPPTVTQVEPHFGPPSGGTTVTITGTNFTGVTAVNFGGPDAPSFTVNSETSITAVSPAGVGRGDVSVTAAGGTSATTNEIFDRFEWTPQVRRVVPRSGPNAGGTTVEVVGANFIGVNAVKFGSTNATSFTVNSETSITALTPPFTSGSASVPVSVSGAGGVSSTENLSSILQEFFFGYEPIVTSVSPNTGPSAGGTSVTIRGKAFESVRGPDEFTPFVKSVKFGPTNATSFEVHKPGLPGEEPFVTAVAPAGTGTVDVTVETYAGASPTSSADQFSYAEPPPTLPTVTMVTPCCGPPSGGTAVTITGTGFSGATAVKFGENNAASFTVNSPTSITAVSPASSGTGLVDVMVTTPEGTSPIHPETDEFLYGPTVTKVEPNRGSPGGGTTVKITGTGFFGVATVKFGSTNAKSFFVDSGTSIIAVTPKAKGAATVDVTVSTPVFTSPISAADQFTFSKK